MRESSEERGAFQLAGSRRSARVSLYDGSAQFTSSLTIIGAYTPPLSLTHLSKPLQLGLRGFQCGARQRGDIGFEFLAKKY
jgi:hypothetical protein